MKDLQIAKVCHEVNRAYCVALGDHSQQAWEDAPDWQRTSAVSGVEFHRENPSAGPDSSHNSWLAEKVNAGWQYGPVKDAELREHPCIVPFEDLPSEQKAKDYIFSAIVKAITAHMGDYIDPDSIDGYR